MKKLVKYKTAWEYWKALPEEYRDAVTNELNQTPKGHLIELLLRRSDSSFISKIVQEHAVNRLLAVEARQ